MRMKLKQIKINAIKTKLKDQTHELSNIQLLQKENDTWQQSMVNVTKHNKDVEIEENNNDNDDVNNNNVSSYEIDKSNQEL